MWSYIRNNTWIIHGMKYDINIRHDILHTICIKDKITYDLKYKCMV